MKQKQQLHIRQYNKHFYRRLAAGDFTLEVLGASGGQIEMVIFCCGVMVRETVSSTDSDILPPGPASGNLAAFNTLPTIVGPKDNKDRLERIVMRRASLALRKCFSGLPYPVPEYAYKSALVRLAVRHNQKRRFWWRLVPPKPLPLLQALKMRLT